MKVSAVEAEEEEMRTMRNRHSKFRFSFRSPACALAVALLLALSASAAQAGERAGELVNTGYFGGVAIKGYDPVAYFTEERAIKGSAEYSHRWMGATWHFDSAKNRDLFAGNPVKYAPQYGGHCADGVSFGTITTNIDPEAWRIIEGKLYLSYDPGAAEGLVSNPDKVVSAQKYWPDVKQTLITEKSEKNWETDSTPTN